MLSNSVGNTESAKGAVQVQCQAIETDQITSNVIGTLLLLRLISIKYYL